MVCRPTSNQQQLPGGVGLLLQRNVALSKRSQAAAEVPGAAVRAAVRAAA